MCRCGGICMYRRGRNYIFPCVLFFYYCGDVQVNGYLKGIFQKCIDSCFLGFIPSQGFITFLKKRTSSNRPSVYIGTTRFLLPNPLVSFSKQIFPGTCNTGHLAYPDSRASTGGRSWEWVQENVEGERDLYLLKSSCQEFNLPKLNIHHPLVLLLGNTNGKLHGWS